LAFTVPISFFAYTKGYDAKRFVKVVQYANNKGEKAARVYGLALRIMLAGSTPIHSNIIDSHDIAMKNELISALQRLKDHVNSTRHVDYRFKAYKALFARFHKGNQVSKASKHAESQLVSAFESFPRLELHADGSICTDRSENNVTRALLFALHNAQYNNADGDMTRVCSKTAPEFPTWLHELSRAQYGDLGFRRNLLVEKAICILESPLEDY
jgi:hypothetical protein